MDGGLPFSAHEHFLALGLDESHFHDGYIDVAGEHLAGI
jgi:hypothetical protein